MAFGVLAPLIAFGVDASVQLNPLSWGATRLAREPELGDGPFLRPILVAALALLSMAGMIGLLVRPRARPVIPLLALGVVLSTAHAVVFLPLLPVSLFAIMLMGIGLLGLCPFLTLSAYYQALGYALQTPTPGKEGPRRPRRLRGISVGAGVLLGVLHWVVPWSCAYPAPAARHLSALDKGAVRRAAGELIARTAVWPGGAVHPERSAIPEPLRTLAHDATVEVTSEGVLLRWSEPGSPYPYGYSLWILTAGQDLPPQGGTCWRHVEVASGLWSSYVAKVEPPGGGPVYQRRRP